MRKLADNARSSGSGRFKIALHLVPKASRPNVQIWSFEHSTTVAATACRSILLNYAVRLGAAVDDPFVYLKHVFANDFERVATTYKGFTLHAHGLTSFRAQVQ